MVLQYVKVFCICINLVEMSAKCSIGTTSVQLKTYHSEYMLSFVHMYECQKCFRAKLKNCRVATGDTELRPPGSCQLLHYMLPSPSLLFNHLNHNPGVYFQQGKNILACFLVWMFTTGSSKDWQLDLGFDSLRLLGLPLCINQCYWWCLWWMRLYSC